MLTKIVLFAAFAQFASSTVDSRQARRESRNCGLDQPCGNITECKSDEGPLVFARVLQALAIKLPPNGYSTLLQCQKQTVTGGVKYYMRIQHSILVCRSDTFPGCKRNTSPYHLKIHAPDDSELLFRESSAGPEFGMPELGCKLKTEYFIQHIEVIDELMKSVVEKRFGPNLRPIFNDLQIIGAKSCDQLCKQTIYFIRRVTIPESGTFDYVVREPCCLKLEEFKKSDWKQPLMPF